MLGQREPLKLTLGHAEVHDMPGAFGLARYISTFLFQVTQRDPLVFTAVPLTLAVVAFIAVWVPAMRASRVDPLQALRYE